MMGRVLEAFPNKTDFKQEYLEMTDYKILTKHPLRKSGKNIDKQKYESLKKARVLRTSPKARA